ncbi:MAG: hypothetical protein Kow0058_06410 [Roseovarius sp.]
MRQISVLGAGVADVARGPWDRRLASALSGQSRRRTRHEREGMILITPDEGPSGLSSSIRALERQLADMRAELEDIYVRIKDGDLGALKDATRATEEIRKWLKIALEAEVQLEKRKSREKGIAHDFAIDFAAARDSIRCRLDRLRRAADRE